MGTGLSPAGVAGPCPILTPPSPAPGRRARFRRLFAGGRATASSRSRARPSPCASRAGGLRGTKPELTRLPLLGGGKDRSPQAPRDRNQAALQAGKWESAPAASGDNRNFGNDSKRRRISPPSAAGLGNVRLSVGFVGAVLLPLLPPAHSGRGAGNQNPPQPLQTKPQTTRSTLSPGSAQQLEAPTGSWGDPAVPEGIWVSAGLAALLAAPGHSAILVGPRSMGRWQRTKSEFSHLQ